MDIRQFYAVLGAYRTELSARQADTLTACARALDTRDWEGLVELILIMQELASSTSRYEDVRNRIVEFESQRCIHVNVLSLL
jgi:hypothetical protein